MSNRAFEILWTPDGKSRGRTEGVPTPKSVQDKWAPSQLANGQMQQLPAETDCNPSSRPPVA